PAPPGRPGAGLPGTGLPGAGRPVAAPPGAPAGGSTPPEAAGRTCQEPGCGGTVTADGYCDTCGMAAEPTSGSVRRVADPGIDPHISSPTIAPPTSPSTQSRRRAGAPIGSRRTGSTGPGSSRRTGLGAGLVSITITPPGDPAEVVMSEEAVKKVLGVVPEQERTCSVCGRPVGRGQDGRAGRVKGFCGGCRTQFDFVTNEPGLRRGEVVAGQYEILGPMAHGGMGWIYLGRDRAVSNRWVVLKGLLNEADGDAVLAAVAERQFLAEIEHANIVNIYNFVTHRGSGYIVMEMVGGESLNAKLKRRRNDNGGTPDPLPPTEAIAYVLGVLPAFGYLHDRGLVYNDLKPANVMAVGDDVKLIDVGAVMRIEDQQAAIFGTQGFQAPEVAEHGPSIPSDLYTVGRTLAILMLDFVFHDGAYLHALPGRDTQPLLIQWESLHRFLLRACAVDPDDRFQSAAEMADQLTGVLREIVAVSEGRPRPATSALFEADQLVNLLKLPGYDVGQADWRVLPSSRIDETDPAATFLLGLPVGEPTRALELLAEGLRTQQVEDSPEVDLHQARELVESGADPEPALARVEARDPWDWRIQWYRAIRLLHEGRFVEAADRFGQVWTDLPGEPAPKLAVALAAELAGDYARAAGIYDLVISTDTAHVSAAFGLARCRMRMGDRPGVIEALDRVPPSSAAHHAAQVATARSLASGGGSGEPTAAELSAAAATIERLQLDPRQRTVLAADVMERALVGLRSGRLAAGSEQLLGRRLDERDLCRGIEEAYRIQARLSTDPAQRVQLVDAANQVRPRSLL
ncbi:MAG: tetratricopeptide repeat protein, partial [Acidimicrobiales bacterium]